MAFTVAVATAGISVGITASSVALIGLGLESAIELLAAGVVVLQLRRGRERDENRAARVIGVTFMASAGYLAGESIHELAAYEPSAHPGTGVILAAVALVVMTALALAKRRVGKALGSATMLADAAETAISAITAAAALLGIGLDAWLGWWWAVPAAGLVIAALSATEGVRSLTARH
jgi:divalent metal cation (Fe/Co/Zn/Cd) transporter